MFLIKTPKSPFHIGSRKINLEGYEQMYIFEQSFYSKHLDAQMLCSQNSLPKLAQNICKKHHLKWVSFEFFHPNGTQIHPP